MRNYFNSTFRIKVDADKSIKPPRLSRVARLRRGGKLRAGKRTNEWIAVRRRLKVQYEAAGITRCELNYDGCKRDTWLSFAHGKKRRHLQGDELETLVCLACTHCHEIIERLPEAEMCQIVKDVIQRREQAA